MARRLRIAGFSTFAVAAAGLAISPLAAGQAHADTGAEHLFEAAVLDFTNRPSAAARIDILAAPAGPAPDAGLVISGAEVESFALPASAPGVRLALVSVLAEPEPPRYGVRSSAMPEPDGDDSQLAPVFTTGIADGIPGAQAASYRLPMMPQWPEEPRSGGIAAWQTTDRTEYAFQFLNVVDLLQTVTALQTGNAYEANPVYGRNPSIATLLAAKTLVGAVHYALTDYLVEESPVLAAVWQYSTLALMSGVVSWNMQFVF